MGTARPVSEAATTAKFPRRHGRRKRVGPQSLPPPPGGTIVPEAVPTLDVYETEEELAITSRLSRPDIEQAIASGLEAAHASEDGGVLGLELADLEAVPNLSELAAYAGPDSFRKDRKYQRASTTPLPHRLARLQDEDGEGDEDGARAAGDGESSDVASRVDGDARAAGDRAVSAGETDESSGTGGSRVSAVGAARAAAADDAGSVVGRAERRPGSGPTDAVAAADAGAREVERDAAPSEHESAPMAVAGPASHRYFPLLLAITALAVGIVIGALLFANRGTSAGACPDPSAHGEAAHSVSASPSAH